MSQVDQIRADIEALETRRAKVEKNLAQPASSPADRQNWQNELANLIQQIKNKREHLDSIEGAAASAVAAVEAEQDTVEIAGVSLRELFLSPTHYEFYLAWRKQTAGEEAAAQAALESSYKSEIQALEEQIVSLNGEIGEYQFLQSTAAHLQLTIDDLNAKRDAAGEKIAELESEVERLSKDNESLREQLKSKPTSTPTNTTANLAELAKQIQAAKPGIYNKRWRDENRKTHYVATLSATGEDIEIPFLEIGKYREETAEEAEAFRQQKAAEEAAKVAEEVVANGVEPPPLGQFPGEEEGAIDSVGGDTSPEEVVGETVTRAEFEALKKRVAALEPAYELSA